MKAKLVLILCSYFVVHCPAVAAGHACFTAKVVDEERQPLSNASVSAAFLGIGVNSVIQEGISDTNGEVRFIGATSIFGNANFGVTAKGCYESIEVIKFKEIVAGRWQPWNPVVTAMVRRILNPIPMYAKQVEIKLPAENTLLCFDLEQGDWVSPYGTGQTTDFQFICSKRVSGWSDFDCSFVLVFSNKFDGIIENNNRFVDSKFHYPRFVPETDLFSTNLSFRITEDSKTRRHGDLDVFCGGNPEKSYFFRTRSKKDLNGNLIEANYGKIDGQFRFIGAAAAESKIMFTYYLNPTPNDRNMEFDPKRNLLQNLKSTEEVRAP